ncbi:MAG TPA: hypothetical protein VM165_10205 [Planctomycetaceae bacterium]|nr:hypothetical protein [Planctomycetaceae bacterium]
MTGYTVHTGSNKKFTSGWDRVFSSSGAKKSSGKAAAQGAKAKKTGKKRSKG